MITIIHVYNAMVSFERVLVVKLKHFNISKSMGQINNLADDSKLGGILVKIVIKKL